MMMTNPTQSQAFDSSFMQAIIQASDSTILTSTANNNNNEIDLGEVSGNTTQPASPIQNSKDDVDLLNSRKNSITANNSNFSSLNTPDLLFSSSLPANNFKSNNPFLEFSPIPPLNSQIHLSAPTSPFGEALFSLTQKTSDNNLEDIQRYSMNLNQLQNRGRYSQSIRSRRGRKNDDDAVSIISTFSYHSNMEFTNQEPSNPFKTPIPDKPSPPAEPTQLLPKDHGPSLLFEPLSIAKENQYVMEPESLPNVDEDVKFVNHVDKRMSLYRNPSRRASTRRPLSISSKPRPTSFALPSYATSLPNYLDMAKQEVGTSEAPNQLNRRVSIINNPNQMLTHRRRLTAADGRIIPGSISHQRKSSVARSKTMIKPKVDEDMIAWEEAKATWKQYHRLSRHISKKLNKRMTLDDEDRVLIGTRVGEGHQNYALMYNMLTGIRVSVSRCNAKLDRNLADSDFRAAHKMTFDVTGNELTPSSKYDFKFKDYAPWVFRHIRDLFKIDPAEYLMSLTAKYILSELFSPGKSRSFFYYSRDFRFIIKTVHPVEHRFMRKILPEYHEYVKNNPNTLLTRIYGLHRVKLPYHKKIHFVVMANLFPPDKEIHETYDLKGSTLGRVVDEEKVRENPTMPMKDLNWANRDKKFKLGPEKKKIFSDQLHKDAEFLRRMNIMDYSLLVGIHYKNARDSTQPKNSGMTAFEPDVEKLAQMSISHDRRSQATALKKTLADSDPVPIEAPDTWDSPPQAQFSEQSIFYKDDGGIRGSDELDNPNEVVYYMGIIDILTPYNYAKKVEHYWKGMQYDRHAISAVKPKHYAQRFVDFMHESLSIGDDNDKWTTINSNQNSPYSNRNALAQIPSEPESIEGIQQHVRYGSDL